MNAAIERFSKDQKNIEILFNHMNDGLMITNNKREIVVVNPAFERMTGYSLNESVGKNPSFLQSGKTPRSTYIEMWDDIEKKGSWTGELLNKRKDGEIFWSFITVTEIKQPLDEDTYFIGIMRDMTSRKKQEELMEHLAYHDSMTQLPNRIYFKKSLETAIAEVGPSEKIAVLFLDLDRFKKINDSFGHQEGDKVLIELSNRLKKVIGQKGLISRFAGDEFTIYIPYSDEVCLESLIDEIFETIHVPFLVSDQVFYLTLSIGISKFPEHGSNVDMLLKNADSAMYRTKDEGRNNYRFYKEEMNEKTADDLSLEAALRDALQNGELEVYYQVQVDLEHRKPFGVEALVRWNHPTTGVMPPISFLPLAEEMGMLADIDEWVLRKAVKQGSLWHNQGFTDLKVSVNISKPFFQVVNFTAIVKEVLAESAMKPSLLCLEVTENMAILQLQEIQEKLLALKELGVNVSLDDFGTGYSSLSQLNFFPIDTLKIDQSFVRGKSTKEKKAIIKLIIAMAQSLNVSVICEGVETEEQIELIKNKGCTYAQGYFFSKPVPPNECEAIMHELNRK
ncbi:EAL domain-containing protein [Alkalihalobacillus sp. MEB130]|uniref:putative bifunctional diguanylate cyclase/phosphodiesterase n=1 Tax=Alkalihalobacillus sp. MEB130 TaxID=2976704 RepID=UPI0028DEA984|nr:EAL domain-containing protein [Alkalihalobacillus sp. MEB130]MDT8860411.1 EAL domain-containing protein [Alkalihalobacillus sp. MEB130]